MKKRIKRFIEFLIRRDPFGNFLIIKRFAISVIGIFTYGRYNIANKMKVKGTEHISGLPNNNVLFLSNHQTYFADVIAFYHIFSAIKWNFKNTIKYPMYLLAPRVKSYYVAASETMNDSGILPKILSLGGAVTVNRSWRANGENVKRGVDPNANAKIGKALSHGWVVSFPQGTTSPYAPIRKGTAHLIQEFNPIVVPVEIDGFRRAFDKKGLFFKKRDTELQVTFKEPLRFDPDSSIEEITKKVEEAIGQQIPEGDWAKPIIENLERKMKKRQPQTTNQAV